jgi:hypothetical protein
MYWVYWFSSKMSDRPGILEESQLRLICRCGAPSNRSLSSRLFERRELYFEFSNTQKTCCIHNVHTYRVFSLEYTCMHACMHTYVHTIPRCSRQRRGCENSRRHLLVIYHSFLHSSIHTHCPPIIELMCNNLKPAWQITFPSLARMHSQFIDQLNHSSRAICGAPQI